MKRPRLRGRWPWLGLGLLIVPALAWLAVLAVVPTDWARARLVDRLARATGRPVRIGALKLGVLGQLRILDLAIAEASTPDDPWLKAAEVGVDLHLGQVLRGPCTPKEVRVDGLALRVWRKKDGTMEFGDILHPAKGARKGLGDAAKDDHSASMALVVHGGAVRFVDEADGVRLDLTGIEAKGTRGRLVATIDHLKGTLNGGTFALAARLDRSEASPRFQAEVQAGGVEVDRGLRALEAFVPVVSGRAEAGPASASTSASSSVSGRLKLKLAVQGQGANAKEIRRSLKGHGSILLDPVDLGGSRFLGELEALGEWPAKARVGSVGADFTVGGGRFVSRNLTILVSRFPFVLEGWTDFDGRFDLSSRGDQILARLPGEARAWLKESKADLDPLSALRVRGDRGRVEVTIHDRPLSGDPTRPDGERTRFRQAARRIRDRFFQ